MISQVELILFIKVSALLTPLALGAFGCIVPLYPLVSPSVNPFHTIALFLYPLKTIKWSDSNNSSATADELFECVLSFTGLLEGMERIEQLILSPELLEAGVTHSCRKFCYIKVLL